MRLGEIDRSLKPVKKSLFLCKPDKKTIKKLTEAYDINYVTQLGTVNEISFKIPAVLEKERVLIDNPNIELIRHRYLFKLIHGSSTEYFVFNEENKSFSDEEYVEYKAFSLGYQLNDKSIREIEMTSKNLSEMMLEVLRYTNWKVGYVDSEFDLKRRGHEVNSQTVLQVVYDLAQKFNAVIQWDTIKQTISFYRPENVGQDKGFRLKYGKYLESFNLATNSEEALTRLKVFGQEGLSIRRLTPTGANYLEDFSWYMHPFKMDEDGEVIEQSHYLSDELCIALTKYNQLLQDVQGRFDRLTTQMTNKQNDIQKAEQELSVLKTELVKIKDAIDVSNSSFQNESPNHQKLISDRRAKETEIETKIDEVENLWSEEGLIQKELDDLNISVIMDNNFTPQQLLELNQFIIEKEYVNDIIVDDEDLLEDGLEAFRKFREPKLDLNINIVNFLEIVECQNDWDKLVLGDTIRIQHDRLGVDIQAKIIEISYSFESGEITLVIANEREMSQIDDFMKKLYDATNTSTIVNMDKYKWDLSMENNGMINQIINNKWDSLKNSIIAGYEQMIEISERGIIVRSPEDPESWLVIQNGFLSITNDSGNNWKYAISKDGIYGEQIFGKIISGVNLAIEDESGIWVTRGSRTTIFDRNGDEQMRLGLVTDSPDPECFGMVLDNRKHKVSVTSCVGFQIEKWNAGQWEKKMYADLDGNFWVENFTAKELTIIDNDGYFKFEGNKGTVSDGSKDVMWLGYIPIAPCNTYNDFGVILSGANNSTVFMSKNRGFAIDVNCENKFSVDTSGNLYAQDVIAHNLKIVDGELGEKIILDENDGITINGNNGEQIRLNANEGIAVDVAGDKRIWIGNDGLIYAKKLYIMGDDSDEIIEDVDGSYISDLTVNRLKTLNSSAAQDFVHIEDNFVRLRTKNYEGSLSSDESITKFELTFKGSGDSAYPHTTWGAGGAGGEGYNQGFLYKDPSGFRMEYNSSTNRKRQISMNTGASESILLKTEDRIKISGDDRVRIEVDSNNYMEISSAGVVIRGLRVDIN